MASKIITDNPKHHKYVTTNKYERKKNIIKKHNTVNINLINNRNYLIYTILYNLIKYINSLCIYDNNFKIHNSLNPFIGQEGCKIIYTDCNHTKYQVIKNGKYIKDKQGNIKTFKKL